MQRGQIAVSQRPQSKFVSTLGCRSQRTPMPPCLATIPAAVTGGNVPEVMPVPAPECDARNLKPKTIGDIITCTPLNP